AGAEHAAVQHVESGKEGRSAIALVIMGQRLAAALLEGQPRLRAIQSLDLAFFVARKHQGVLRRVEVEADDILELFFKAGVVGEFEGFDPMWFQPGTRPDSTDTR